MFHWLRTLFGPAPKDIPGGWTDDMTFPLPQGMTFEILVDRVLGELMSGAEGANVVDGLVSQIGLSEEDAHLALDRTLGGVVRAATGNPLNRPDRAKDPMAWLSFERATS